MSVIRCENCGAEYEENAEKCPYCGAFNKKELKRLQKEEQEWFHREKEKVKELPKHHVKKGTKIVILVLAFALILLLAYSAVHKIRLGASAKREQSEEAKAKEVMEGYFQEGKYLEIYDYYTDLNLYSPSFRKYWEVGSARNWMEYMDETKAALETEQDGYVYYGISFALSGNSEALSIIHEGLNDGVDRGNEAVLEAFEEEIMTFFREDLKLTEEEISQVIAAEGGGTEDWDAMEEAVLERLNIEQK